MAPRLLCSERVRGSKRLGGASAVIAIAAASAGCTRLPREAPPSPLLPTLDPDPPVDPRPIGLDDLRSIAGAASIALEVGPAPALTTSGCQPGAAAPGAIAAPGTGHGAATCYRCTLAVLEASPDGKLHPLEPALRRLAATLLVYPHSFLRAAKIQKLALCAELVEQPVPASGMTVAGLAEGSARRLMVSLARATDERARPDVTLHHEIYHLFDQATEPDGDHAGDPEWERINPRTFRYQPEPSSELEAGFIDDYAKTAPAEDKAEVFSYMMGHADELCARAADDPLLRAKARLVLARVTAAVPPGMAAFVERRASCIAP
jgi:hypothetical protein